MEVIKANYDSGEYEVTIKSIDKIQDGNLKNKILIYKGVSFYELKKLGEAEKVFLTLKQTPNSVKYNASWYLAMIYLKQKKINKATIELKLIKDNPSGVMSEEATALLNDLSPSK